MSHRKAVVIGAGIVVPFELPPLYKSVRQELVPGNVDEAEFDVQRGRPRGDEPGRHGRAMREWEPRDPRDAGVTDRPTSVGGSFSGSEQRTRLRPDQKPHEERVFGFGRIGHELANLTPWRGLLPAITASAM